MSKVKQILRSLLEKKEISQEGYDLVILTMRQDADFFSSIGKDNLINFLREIKDFVPATEYTYYKLRHGIDLADF